MKDSDNTPEKGLFSHTDDYINLSEVVRDYPQYNEVTLRSQKHYLEAIKTLNGEISAIPIFIKTNDDAIHIIPSFSENMIVEEGSILMYLGKTMDV